MITGAIKSQIDQIWNAFWSGGISNPIEVIEQITYFLSTRRVYDLHTLEEGRPGRLGKPMERCVFPESKDGIGEAAAVRTKICGGAISSISFWPRGTASSRTRD